jgi:murein DD-endopeptidase MepM/ murein hydrolase activator NlpD
MAPVAKAKPAAAKPKPTARATATPEPAAEKAIRVSNPTAAQAAASKKAASVARRPVAVATTAVGTEPAPRPTPYRRVELPAPGTEAPGVVAPVVVAPVIGGPVVGGPVVGAPVVVVKDVLAPVVVVKDAPAPVRPVEAVPAPAGPVGPGVAEVVPTGAEAAREGAGRRRWSLRRRPALYVAAALVGALSIGALVAAEESAAQSPTTTVSASVSVAEQLGITAETDQPITAADTARLEELAASRKERDTEQAHAALVQSRADRVVAVANAAAAAEAARPDAVLPVQGGRLTSGFGGRWGRLHAGIDLAAPMMTPERAVMAGIVLQAGPSSGYGNVVCIQHDNGDVSVYGHMEKILVKAGQVVRAGDTIALLGNRGRSTGPHLHFEVHVGGLDGRKIDPLPWLRARGIHV